MPRRLLDAPAVTLLALAVTLWNASLAAERRTEELRVESSGDVVLAGTLFLPKGEGPFPVVVLTHGSEAGQRSHPGYRRQADALRGRGVAALVFDKRGVGDSTGVYVEAPDLQVPADDVIAWVDRLRTRPEIRSDAIGVLGWSQGGWVGPLAASQSRHLAFVVSISGPGVSPLEQNIYDKTNQFRASGASQARVERFSSVIRKVWTYLVTGEGGEAAQAAWDAVADEKWFERGYHGPPMMDRDTILAHPRMTHYVAHSSYEPGPVLARLEIPMLAVFGSEDTVVPVERSVAEMRAAFRRGGSERLTIRVFPGGDHGIRVAEADGSRRAAPGFQEFVVGWIVDVVSPSVPSAE